MFCSWTSKLQKFKLGRVKKSLLVLAAPCYNSAILNNTQRLQTTTTSEHSTCPEYLDFAAVFVRWATLWNFTSVIWISEPDPRISASQYKLFFLLCWYQYFQIPDIPFLSSSFQVFFSLRCCWGCRGYHGAGWSWPVPRVWFRDCRQQRGSSRGYSSIWWPRADCIILTFVLQYARTERHPFTWQGRTIRVNVAQASDCKGLW